MPVALSITESEFNVQLHVADWNHGLVITQSGSVIPAPAHLSVDYLRLLPEGGSWYDTIPIYWLERVSSFPDHQLRLLSLVARSARCQQIMGSSHRLILYLAVHYFPFDDQRIIEAASQGITELLACMQLPSTHDALAFIERVDRSAFLYVSEIQTLLTNHQYRGFSAYSVITKTVLQLNRRYPHITNTTLAVWLTRLCQDELPGYVTDLLDEIADLVRQKAIPGGWRRFISLTSFADMEQKLVRYKTLQRYRFAVGGLTEKKQELECSEDLPVFDALAVINRPRTLLRYCLSLQPPRLESECWDLFMAVLNKQAVLYQLPKPNSGILALQIFRDSESKIKGLRFLCARPKYHKTTSFNVLDDVMAGLDKFQSRTSIKIDYDHPWF